MSRFLEAKYDIPAIRVLIAFEATARLGGVSRAAEELKTSQSAISRYIGQLEAGLGVRVFERRNRGVVLTKRGQDYYLAIQSSLEHLHAAGHRIRSQSTVLTIACTQEISVLFLRPVFARLKRSLARGVGLRILNCDYDILPLVVPTGVDIVFEYSVARNDADSARVLEEEIVPVASPAFASRFERALSEHPRHWCGVPRLEVARRDQCWSTWASWFAPHGCELAQAPVESFENYLHLLDAAANGDGLAIGWNGFVNRFLRSGSLVPLRDDWLATNVGLYAVLTPYGRTNPDARDCIRTLTSLSKESVDVRIPQQFHSHRRSPSRPVPSPHGMLAS